MKRKYQELLAVLIILFIYLGIFINPSLIIESGIIVLISLKLNYSLQYFLSLS